MKQAILGIDPEERIILDVRRHPVGIVGFALFGLSTILIILLVLFLVVSANDFSAGVLTALTIGAIIFGLFVMLITVISISIYRTNELIVTNENIVQILKQSLIDKKVSQLNLSKVQDVSVDQEGWLPTIFNYGTIKIETAGESNNYIFSHTANPPIVAKKIVEAHEAYMANMTSSGDGI